MGYKELLSDPGFRKIIVVFLIAKLVVLGAGYAGYFGIPVDVSSRKYVTPNELLNPWAQFDGKAYLDIAVNGYNAQFDGIGNYGFFPLYPVLIRTLGFLGYDLAAFLLSNAFSFLAVVMLYKIVKEEFGAGVTKKAITYILLFPTAYFFSVMYTESLFLFLTVAAFFYARRGNWVAAGAFGFLAALTRIQGVLLFLPIAYLYMKERKFDPRKIEPDSIFTLLIPAGLLLFILYVYSLTGNPFAASQGFAAHGKHLSLPWETFYNEAVKFSQMTELKGYIYFVFNAVVASTFVVLSFISLKHLKKDYSIYFICSALLPLFSGSLEAVSRYGLAIFPAFILMPLLEKKYPHISTPIKILLVISIVILIVLTVRHVNMHLDPYGL